MKIVLIVIITVFAVYNILSLFGVFEFASRPSKTVSEIDTRRKFNKKRGRVAKWLGLLSSCTSLFRNIFMPPAVYERHAYYIKRLEIRNEVLDRMFTPEELRGRYVFPFLVSLLFLPLGVFVPVFFIFPVLSLLVLLTYQGVYKAKVADEDAILDNYFIDLYLLLYSKLRQGARARLQGTVEGYINTLENSRRSVEYDVMMKFSKYFLNLLSAYEDHVAIPHLRDYYNSATVINFCNIATQALIGVDNFDNLLTFKMQLTERRTRIMIERQQKILAKGERSIYLIWLILFVFIAVGWYSKLPKGFF